MTREEAKTILEEVKMLDDSMYQYNPIYLEALDMAISALKEKFTDEVVQKIRTAIGVNLYEIAGKFNESYGDAAIYLQELIDKAVSE